MSENLSILKQLANCIRFLAIDAVQQANSGHPGMPMGMADIATVLFKDFLKFDPSDPNWLDRDRFVLSNGHGSMLLYACLYLTGYKGITLSQIKNFRQLNSVTAGHPEYNEIPGIETTTGPLAQGLANATGIALAERILNSRFGDKTFNHFTYVFVGDGCLMEGLSHEVCSFAGHLNLSKLIVFFDDNSISIDGSTDLSVSDDHIKRFKSYGWATISINGHDHNQISNAPKNDDTYDFISGNSVSKDPLLIVDLFDLNGINITEINSFHTMRAIVDDTIEIKLNDYFITSKNEYKQGVIRYPLNGLEIGKHKIEIKVSDTYNNLSFKSVVFVIDNNNLFNLYNLMNYPNPFSYETTFSFDHDSGEQPLFIHLEVFDLRGTKLYHYEEILEYSNSHVDGIIWNGNDMNNNILPQGIYIYKLHVKNLYDNSSITTFNKMIKTY